MSKEAAAAATPRAAYCSNLRRVKLAGSEVASGFKIDIAIGREKYGIAISIARAARVTRQLLNLFRRIGRVGRVNFYLCFPTFISGRSPLSGDQDFF
jgi:hypothetical protein